MAAAAPDAAALAKQVAALQEQVKEAEKRAEAHEVEKGEFARREERLGNRIVKLTEERKALAEAGGLEAQRRQHAAEIRQMKEELARVRAGQQTSQAALGRKDLEIKGLKDRVEELSSTDRQTDAAVEKVQAHWQGVVKEKEVELQGVLVQRREAELGKVEAAAKQSVAQHRIDTLSGRLDAAERHAAELRDTVSKERRTAAAAEAALRRELHTLKSTARASQNETLCLRTQYDITREEMRQTTSRLRKLQEKMHAETVARAKEHERAEKERHFARQEVERLKLFVARLEEGRTDPEVLQKIVGDGVTSVDQKALENLAAAQRLVADELDLSMSNAYCKWIELRERLQAAEEENTRLIDSQQAVVEACEAMAPKIFEQQKECQGLLKQHHRLQTLHSQLLANHNATKAQLDKETAAHKAAQEQLEVLKKNNLALEQSLRQWAAGGAPAAAAKEEITREETTPVKGGAPGATTTTTAATADSLPQVTERYLALQREAATLQQKLRQVTDAGEREAEIEARVKAGLTKVKASFDTVNAELATAQESLATVRKERDEVVHILAQYAKVAGEADLAATTEDFARRTGAPMEAAVVATTEEEKKPQDQLALQRELTAAATAHRSNQVEDLKAQLREMQLKLQGAQGDLDAAREDAAELESKLKREHRLREELNTKIITQVEATLAEEEGALARRKELLLLQQSQDTLAAEVRGLRTRVAQEESKNASLAKELETLGASKQKAVDLYNAALSDNTRLERLAVEVQSVFAGVKTTQTEEVAEKASLLDEQVRRIEQLQELLKEEREDWERGTKDLKVRLAEAKENEFRKAAECHLHETEALKLRQQVEAAEAHVAHATARATFLETQLQKILCESSAGAEGAALDKHTITSLRKELELVTQARDALAKQLDDTQSEHRTSRIEYDTMKRYNDDLARRAEVMEHELRTAQQSAAAANQELQTRLDEALAAQERLRSDATEKDEQVQVYARMVAKGEDDNVQAAAAGEQLRQRIVELEARLKDAEGKRAEANIKLGDAMKDLQASKEVRAQLQVQLTQQAAKVQAAEGVGASKAEVEEMKAKLGRQAEHNQKLEASLKERNSMFEQLGEILRAEGEAAAPQSDTRVQSLKQTLTKYKLMLKKQQEEIHLLGQRPAVRPSAEPTIDAFKELHKRLSERATLTENYAAEITAALGRERDARADLESQRRGLREELATMRREKGKSDQRARNQPLLDDAKAEIREKTKENRKLQQTIAGLQTQLSEKAREEDAARSRLTELGVALEQQTGAEEKMREELTALEEQLRSAEAKAAIAQAETAAAVAAAAASPAVPLPATQPVAGTKRKRSPTPEDPPAAAPDADTSVDEPSTKRVKAHDGAAVPAPQAAAAQEAAAAAAAAAAAFEQEVLDEAAVDEETTVAAAADDPEEEAVALQAPEEADEVEDPAGAEATGDEEMAVADEEQDIPAADDDAGSEEAADTTGGAADEAVAAAAAEAEEEAAVEEVPAGDDAAMDEGVEEVPAADEAEAAEDVAETASPSPSASPEPAAEEGEPAVAVEPTAEPADAAAAPARDEQTPSPPPQDPAADDAAAKAAAEAEAAAQAAEDEAVVEEELEAAAASTPTPAAQPQLTEPPAVPAADASPTPAAASGAGAWASVFAPSAASTSTPKANPFATPAKPTSLPSESIFSSVARPSEAKPEPAKLAVGKMPRAAKGWGTPTAGDASPPVRSGLPTERRGSPSPAKEVVDAPVLRPAVSPPPSAEDARAALQAKRKHLEAMREAELKRQLLQQHQKEQ